MFSLYNKLVIKLKWICLFYIDLTKIIIKKILLWLNFFSSSENLIKKIKKLYDRYLQWMLRII